jgi:glycosyltransferase involved in cell wall biosynthesis
MRVVHFSTSDSHGGAAKVAYRLHAALGAAGHDSHMVVRKKETTDPRVTVAQRSWWRSSWQQCLRHLPWLGVPRASFTFNFDRDTGTRIAPLVRKFTGQTDAICLHWTAKFLTSEQIRSLALALQAPLFWLLLDQEPLTGGCHYSFGCERYRQQCGNCPLLCPAHEFDVSHRIWLRKRQAFADLPLVLIAPTSWCETKARQSSLFGDRRIARIPLPLDETVYAPGDRFSARERLGLPREAKVILFGASYLNEPRKGGQELLAALQSLKTQWQAANRDPAEIQLAVIGERGAEFARAAPFPCTLLGRRNEGADLACAYQAADVFACPSLEDAGPVMIPEALLCGTPVVAFNTGGAPDLVATGETGYLAAPVDVRDFAQGLANVLAHGSPRRIGCTARARALALHSRQIVAEKYGALFAEVVDSKQRRVRSTRQLCG